jgi:hypothetical protein
MKSFLFPLLLGVLLPLGIVAQTQPTNKPLQIDERLYAVYEKDYLETVKKEEPFFIHRWNFYLDNAFFISDNPLSKNGSDEGFPSVIIPDLTNINILKIESEQNLKHDFNTETIFKIKDSGKYLVYYAGRQFVEKLNEYLKSVK